jgi:copper chaperone CopZ
MKILNKQLIVITLLLLVVNLKSYAQISKAEIIATGLTCSMCSNAINKQLKSLKEVDSVSTDLNTNTFTVYLKKVNTLQPKVLKEGVEKAGFFVGSMVLTVAFDNVNVQENQLIKGGNVNYVIVDSKAKTLNGEMKVQVLDKGFVTQKEYKKLVKSLSKIPTYAIENEDDYHIKTLQ